MKFVKVLVLYLTVICVWLVEGGENGDDNDNGPGKPLFLTPFIEKGQLKIGRQRATVKPFVSNVSSYAGYLTVDKKYNSNMFFWYFKSENDPINDPTVIWLQGGPGASSLLGVFKENGPYIITKGKKLIKRQYPWSKRTNLIFFDNPVGTGYSFTQDDAGYATNQTKIGRDLYEALIQILTLFPDIQKNDLFITGESYAGKFALTFGHVIHLKNRQSPKIYVHLKGLIIASGFIDPIHMFMYGNYLYQHGLIDDKTKNQFHKIESKARKMIKQHKWKTATGLFENLVLSENSSLYYRYTGLPSHNNYIDIHSGSWKGYEQEFLTSDAFRSRVHVGNKNFSDGVNVYNKLRDDLTKSVINGVPELLKYYRVLFYSGQVDIICAYPLTVNYLRKMKWPLSHAYKHAKRHIYRVNGDVAGYYKSVGNLTEVLVRDAGHMVPADQPAWSLQLLHDFIHNNFTRKDKDSVSESSQEVS